MKRKIWRYFLLLFCTNFAHFYIVLEDICKKAQPSTKTPTGEYIRSGRYQLSFPHLFIVEQTQLSCFSESRKPVLGIRLQIRNLGSGLVECGILRPPLLSRIYTELLKRKSEMLCEIFLRNPHFCILSLLHHLPNL